MTLSCIISEIKQDIGRKWRFFHTPRIRRPNYGVHVRIFGPILFGTVLLTIGLALQWCEKNRMMWLPDVEKTDDVFSRFDRIPACDGQTDLDILRQHIAR